MRLNVLGPIELVVAGQAVPAGPPKARALLALLAMHARRVPVIFGWLASSADADLLAASYADLPVVARLMFRLFWWPAYRRRFTRLYGATAPANALLES
ncbi:hypothetical protein ACFLIM_36095 [Nonomuraea sp. M3C6]|uniref:Uncharacterized protein n=1 Tax=Nonomuraea marmarensis TaxID=3351344 RepID=A0ABW7AML7_9ACTN